MSSPEPGAAPGPSTAVRPAPGPDMVVAHDVSKWFGDVVAVNQVSFALGPGVTALLGPNGAGKSSVLRLVCGLTAPSRGTVRVLGADPRTDRGVRAHIGLAPQQETLMEGERAVDFVSLAAGLSGVAHPEDAAREALGTVGLDPDLARPLGTYSKGMRQRVKLAQALVHRPTVLVLDEPLTGLDPRQRVQVIDLVRTMGTSGTCVVVSSHVLDEVERFGSRVLVIAQGRLAATGDFRAIRELMDDRPHRIRIRTDRPRPVATGLLALPGVVAVRLEGDDVLVVDTVEVSHLRRNVAVVARAEAAELLEVRPLDDDLESVFLYLVGGGR